MFNVYQLTCNTTGQVYYGKTELTVEKRLEKHRNAYAYFKGTNIKYCTSFEILKNNNYKIKLLEVCNDKIHMKIREGYYIRTFPCVNKNIPARTKKEWYEDNREGILEKVKEYCEANKEKIKEKAKEYREDNREKIAEKGKEYYEANKEKIKEKKKGYYEANKEKIKEYYEANKEKILEKKKETYTCPCGSTLTKDGKSRHERSIKHQNYIKSL